jgi:CheY-like chemotaxis protein
MSTPSPGVRSRTILIVDDEEMGRELIARFLARDAHSYSIAFAASGEEALERVAEIHPDAILLDLGLPGIDGWETLRRLQSAPATSSIPVIVLTAENEPASIIRGYSAGAVYYIPKPVKAEELLRGVRMALAIR